MVANIVLSRLKEAMGEREFDQSSLARAVGCTPGAINQIVSGNVRRSRFAPEIARQLGVSYDWLTGQSDQKNASAPSGMLVAADERLILDDLRQLPLSDRNALARIAAALRSVDQQELAPVLPPEPALARMFEGLLEILEALPNRPNLEERARLLAQWLPIGLSQLRDLIPAEQAAAAPGIRKELVEALATDDLGSRR